MQKLDFTNAVINLEKVLKSKEILSFIDGIPEGKPVNTAPLTSTIIETKSSFDRIDSLSDMYRILSTFEGVNIYSNEFISKLINSLQSAMIGKVAKIQLYLQSDINLFYKFHFSISSISKISRNVLFREKQYASLSQSDTLVFQILISNDYLDISTYSKILKLLDDLINILHEILEPNEEKTSQIVMLDSGSDANIGVKSSLEIAKTLYQIFKEIWDWILNRKFYKNRLRNSALIENLQVMTAINKAEKNKIINEKDATIYKETILRRTEELLELNVLPKSLVDQKSEKSGKKLLSEYNEVKMLESGKKA